MPTISPIFWPHRLSIALQQQQLTMASNFTAATMKATKPKAPSVKFPTWDGTTESVPVFLAQLSSYKGDPFFATVLDWTYTVPSNVVESRRICIDMITSLTKEQLAPYLNNPRFANDGIAMVASLTDKISPSRPENRLQDDRGLAGLEQGSQEGTSSFMARVRGYKSRLTGVTINAIMPFIALIGMDHEKYSGLLARFTIGEPAVVGASLTDLEHLMLEEDSRRRAMGIVNQITGATAS